MRTDLTYLSDEALVALVARHDEDAFAELYDRLGRTAYGLALRILRDESLAEDAVQEAFLVVWRTAARFVPERAKASTWVLTLVHRRAVDLVRRQERRRAEPLETARACADRVVAPPRPPEGGDRAGLLRRLHPVRAGRPAGTAARHD